MVERISYEMLKKGDLVTYRDDIAHAEENLPLRWPVNDVGVVVDTTNRDMIRVQWQKSNRSHRYLREELILVARGTSS